MKMEAEPVLGPEIPLDISIPLPDDPEVSVPKPAVVQHHASLSEKVEPPLLKPTFKSALQAKKRLQAFSSNRPGSLPSSPIKIKLNLEDTSEDAAPMVKKTPKKGHVDKAKEVIKEIEELKREELAYLVGQKQSYKRSRSRSTDRGRFKKVEKKSRNYRRRSITPEKTRKSPKKQKKYPKNWREFYDFNVNFDVNRDFDVALPSGTNDLTRQLIFESPSLPIVPFKMKNVNREEKVVPFEFVRYTQAKPVVPHSVNFSAIKQVFLTRKQILDLLPKNAVSVIEKFLSNSCKFSTAEFSTLRKWYPQAWSGSENECNKVIEKSVGLSFLQSYTGEEEEEEEEEETETVEDVGVSSIVEVKKNENLEPEEPQVEVKPKKVQEGKKKEEVREDKKKKEEVHEAKKKEEIYVDKKKKEEVQQDKKKKEVYEEKKDGEALDDKKKTVKEEYQEPEGVPEKKKRKKKKRKQSEENQSKKKKNKKTKSKKLDKKSKGKKLKRKKAKEKKKKDKDKSYEKSEKSKQQVIDELKEIEEKLAKKKEEKERKATKEEKKGKHSEDDKKIKQEKQNEESHALKNKLKKMESTPKPPKKEPEKKHEKETERKHEKEIEKKHEKEPEKKNENKRSMQTDEVAAPKRKKSRWSDEIPVDFNQDQHIKDESFTHDFDLEDLKVIEDIKQHTPDTDEYHSHWESDDDVSSSVPPRTSLKPNRSWESDEELFERSHNREKKLSDSYSNLEIPLNITNFSRRSSNWDSKPLSVVEELKLLEEERKSLSEERKKLEVEKQKIMRLQEEAKQEDKRSLEDEKRLRSPLTPVKIKKEKCEVNDFSIDSLNSSLLSTVSSTESNFPGAVLENEYEEFIKAVSSESSKRKPERRSSTSSSWSDSDSDHKKKKRKKKKKKKKKSRECEGLLVGKGNDIFNEFDIPVPSDLPEMVPTPVPVPSPLLSLDKILPLTSTLILPPISLPEKPFEQKDDNKPFEGIKKLFEDGMKGFDDVKKPFQDVIDIFEDVKKPFVFSSIVLQTKKPHLVDNSNLKLDDDSADFTDKFAKKPEKDGIEEKTDLQEKKEEETPKLDENPKLDETLPEPEPEPEVVIPPPQTEPKETQEVKLPPPVIEDIQNVPLPPEKSPPPRDTKIKRSRSLSPSRRAKPKRRSRSPTPKRRSPIRRRDLSPPSRRRHLSPRRRTPPRRRSSPWRRSPSPRRRSPRRRKRSPSFSPPRSRNGRKRTPSPRRRASPLNSPLDGFKKSVADSTISDDMLPQPTPDEYNDSPNAYGGGLKYYDRKTKSSLSPQLSPKRISLDDRINLVLGLEKPEAAPPPKIQEVYANYNYGNAYGQYSQFGQYGQQKNEYVQPFTPMMYTQPPPAVVKPAPTPTKVLQVGNILQVVPTEEMTPVVLEPKQAPERAQKIVQVGNMLQIVPAVIPPPPKVPPPVPEPQPVMLPVPVPAPVPEKQSAESLMKQKNAERKAEREKRRLERERRRKEKEQKRKEREKRKQIKIRMKTESMIKRAIQIETEALANEEVEEEGENADQFIPVIVSSSPSSKSILSRGGSKKKKSVQFADGVRPGEGTSPSGGEELSSPPPPKLPKEKRYKKKGKKKKVRVKVVKKVQNVEEEEEEDEVDSYFANLGPPPPPPGSPPPHVFPARVKTHTINNVHQYVGNIIQPNPAGFAYRPAIPVVMNRHQPPPGYMPGAYPADVSSLSHPTYQGVPSHH